VLARQAALAGQDRRVVRKGRTRPGPGAPAARAQPVGALPGVSQRAQPVEKLGVAINRRGNDRLDAKLSGGFPRCRRRWRAWKAWLGLGGTFSPGWGLYATRRAVC